MTSAIAERESLFTRAALRAYDRLDAVTHKLVARYSQPLGTRIVPASTRRARMQRTAEELAELLVGLCRKFGDDQVQEVLGLPGDDGQPLLAALENEYSSEVVRQALGLMARTRKAEMQPRPEELFLAAT